MQNLCDPLIRPTPRKVAPRTGRSVVKSPVEYRSHNRWLLLIVYASWLWILWNMLLFTYLGARDSIQTPQLFPPAFLAGLESVNPEPGSASPPSPNLGPGPETVPRDSFFQGETTLPSAPDKDAALLQEAMPLAPAGALSDPAAPPSEP